jgi:hypothetical protein
LAARRSSRVLKHSPPPWTAALAPRSCIKATSAVVDVRTSHPPPITSIAPLPCRALAQFSRVSDNLDYEITSHWLHDAGPGRNGPGNRQSGIG